MNAPHNNHAHDNGERADNVVYLPAAGEPDGVVLNGELVTDTVRDASAPRVREAYNTRRLVPESARLRMEDGAVQLYRVATPAAKTGFKTAMRHGIYVFAGAGVIGKRLRDAHTNSRYERVMRRAEAEGKWDRLGEWEQRAEAARENRHRRAMEWLGAPMKLAKALAVGALSIVAVLFVLGVVLAVDAGDAGLILQPLAELVDVVRWTWWFAAAYGILMVWGLTIALIAYLWKLGQSRDAWKPAWVQTARQRADEAVVIDADVLTGALATCHVRSLNQALKAGEAIEFIVHPREQGGGTYTQVRLPLGVKAADFLHPDRIETLAGNLSRHRHEVYPQRQPDGDARVLDLWIADKGTMDRPAPEWPLLHDGEFDVFRDRLPIGVTMRREQVSQGMLQRHGFTGALSKQGKTAYMRLKALGLALDPTVELRVADLKGDGDWSMFAPRAHTLIEGGGEEQAVQACEMLEALVVEMQRRYDAKRAQGIKGAIPRALSRKPGSGFHPIYAFIDECQVMYQADKPIGGSGADSRAMKAARRLHDQARAVNIHLWQSTQRPDPNAVPFQVREGAHVRESLHVANQEAAKMVLADAADRGARPQDLRADVDRGTVVAAGEVDDIPMGMAFVIIRSHFVDTEAAYTVIERAMRILEAHGRHVTQPDDDPEPDAGPQTEPLDDIAAVLAEAAARRMRTQEVLQRLTDLNEDRYRHWTFGHLTEYLADTPAAPYKYDGRMVVSADRVREAITERDQAAQGGD